MSSPMARLSFRQMMAQLADAELAKIVVVESDQYVQEAVDAARAELESRGASARDAGTAGSAPTSAQNIGSDLRLFSPGQIGVAATMGTPVAGGYLLFRNFRAVDGSRAISALVLGVLGTVAVVVGATVLSEGVLELVGRSLPLVAGAGWTLIARVQQGAMFKAHFAAGGRKGSIAQVAGATVVSGILVGALVVGVMLLSALPTRTTHPLRQASEHVADALVSLVRDGAPSGFLIVGVEDSDAYVQFARSRNGAELRGEAVSNAFLAQPSWLSPQQEQALLALGWNLASAESGQNHTRYWPSPPATDPAIIAGVVVRTLAEVYGVPTDAVVELTLSSR